MDIWAKIITPENLLFMAKGALMSLLVAASALVLGTVLGTAGAAARLSSRRFLRWISVVYVEVIRGTPMLLQIWFLWLGIPVVVKAITGHGFLPNPWVVGIIAVGINSGAYSTELFRSGIQGVDAGQTEAANALGMTYFQRMRFIILPQAFRRIVPPMCSEFITLVKDSSLLSAIGAMELLTCAKKLGSDFYNYIIPLLLAMVMYLIMTTAISYFARLLERRLSVSDRA